MTPVCGSILNTSGLLDWDLMVYSRSAFLPVSRSVARTVITVEPTETDSRTRVWYEDSSNVGTWSLTSSTLIWEEDTLAGRNVAVTGGNKGLRSDKL